MSLLFDGLDNSYEFEAIFLLLAEFGTFQEGGLGPFMRCRSRREQVPVVKSPPFVQGGLRTKVALGYIGIASRSRGVASETWRQPGYLGAVDPCLEEYAVSFLMGIRCPSLVSPVGGC